MKKLLILGGSKYIIPVIKKAHKLGIFVITCDYLPNNYAHAFSDKYFNISITDKDSILSMAKKEKIDGILSFACDPGVVTASYVAEKMHLPNSGPHESVCLLQNKYLFRTFLKEHGFNVPFFEKYNDIESALNSCHNFPFPVIVKPTDSAGSKGVSRVDSLEQLEKALINAFNVSFKKEVIIEEFICFKNNPSDADSFLFDGELLYFGSDSQLFDNNSSNPYAPAAYYWPSTIDNTNLIVLRNELKRLLSLLRMKTAIFNVEIRESVSGIPYIMEVSPRGGGNRLSEMIEHGTGQDIITELIKYSVGEKINCNIRQENFLPGWCEIVLHSNTEGVFSRLEISNSLQKKIIESDVWVKSGDKISGFNGANCTIGTLILKFETHEEMLSVLRNIDKYVKVKLK